MVSNLEAPDITTEIVLDGEAESTREIRRDLEGFEVCLTTTVEEELIP